MLQQALLLCISDLLQAVCQEATRPAAGCSGQFTLHNLTLQGRRGVAAAAIPSANTLEDSVQLLDLQEQHSSDEALDSCTPAAAPSSVADFGVSQSRASSSIRVAKFHRVLNEPLVSQA